MIYDMGLEDMLFGVSFECPPEAAGKPVLVRFKLEGKFYSSEEIDKIFSGSKARGESLYYVDEELLQSVRPDLIFTQDLCEVCQIDSACTMGAIERLEKKPMLISLSPQTLDEVFETAVTIATAMGRQQAAYSYLNSMQKRIEAITGTLRNHDAPIRRVMMMEWIDPIYNSGHWIPFQVARAGGIDRLSCPGGSSAPISWEKILDYDPEVLLIAPCGFCVERSLEECHLLQNKNGWSRIKAVQNNAVWIADYDFFTQPSPSSLTNGIELLAALFHPTLFQVPEQMKGRFAYLDSIERSHG